MCGVHPLILQPALGTHTPQSPLKRSRAFTRCWMGCLKSGTNEECTHTSRDDDTTASEWTWMETETATESKSTRTSVVKVVFEPQSPNWRKPRTHEHTEITVKHWKPDWEKTKKQDHLSLKIILTSVPPCSTLIHSHARNATFRKKMKVKGKLSRNENLKMQIHVIWLTHLRKLRLTTDFGFKTNLTKCNANLGWKSGLFCAHCV